LSNKSTLKLLTARSSEGAANLRIKLENKTDKNQKSTTPAFLGTFNQRLLSIRDFLDLNEKTINIVSTFISGFLFGFSVSIGLGLTSLSSVALGTLVALGVLVSGSLISYLITQTVALASLAALSLIAFQVIPGFKIEAGVFQVSYILIILLNPLLSLIRRVRSSTNSFVISAPVQLFTTITFALLVQFLRSRLPSEAEFALARMLLGEDNAGIVQILAGSLENGFTPQASKFGEFVNSLYLTAAGLISWFSGSDDSGLLPALTHFNMTLLFMAWVPIAALFVTVLVGRNQKDSVTIAILSVSTIVLAILFWPFVTLGHTSVISSGLFTMLLLALTLNKRLATNNPVAYAVLVTSVGLIIGTTWFPLMPFAAATVALIYLYLLQLEYKKGNVKIVSVLAALLAALSLVLLPRVLSLATNSGDYLELQGGTRSATTGLITLTLFLLGIVTLKLLRFPSDSGVTSKKLFIVIVAVLFSSNAYLLVSALDGNQGEFGYGATKYLITTISISIPVLWILAVEYYELTNFKVITTAGLVLILSILMIQPDTRRVPASIVVPQLITSLLSPPEIIKIPRSLEIASGLRIAFQLKPDHVFCVSDLDVSKFSGAADYDSYVCNRWAGSLNSNEDPFTWGAVALGRGGKDLLSDFQASYSGEDVVVVRILNPVDSTTPALDKSETWWWEYVDESWEVVTVELSQ
jgi:hypothetical protein